MKKSFLPFIAVICLLLIGEVGYAQKGLKLGGFALPQAVVLYNQDDVDLDNDTYQLELLGGMAGGVLIGYNFSNSFGVRLNAIYSQQGGRYSSRRDISTRNNFVTRLEYFKVPLMLGFNTSPVYNKVMFSMYVGGQIGFLTKAYAYNDNPAFELELPASFTQFPTTYQTYEKINYSVVGDIGVDIKLTYNSVMNLRLRADYGLVDSEDKSATYRLTEGGSTRSANYWQWASGSPNRAETTGLTAGILIGLTYTLGSDL